MTDLIRLEVDDVTLEETVEGLREALSDLLDNDLRPIAEEMVDLFADVGDSISNELERAVTTGRISVERMVNDVLADVAKLATDRLIREPLQNGLGSVFGGARVGGGPVSPGLGYLVGERGPEAFFPASAGRVGPLRAAPVSVTITMPEAARSTFPYSDSQMAGLARRALRRAARNG